MQILHPFAGSIQDYTALLVDSNRHRPSTRHCCGGHMPLRAHGFYTRSVLGRGCGETIRVRRYLCLLCRRTVSLLPEFVLPYVRFAIAVIALFLKARLLDGHTLQRSAELAELSDMPYQRGQQWIRRFRVQAGTLAAALVVRARPRAAPDFVSRALAMLEKTGWIEAHRFLFAELRAHLLGWPPSLAPDGR